MRFDERFAEVMLAFRPQFFVPSASVVVDVDEGQVQQTGRKYPCLVCGKRTGWRAVIDGCPYAPLCSEECRQMFLADSTDVDVAHGIGPPPVFDDVSIKVDEIVAWPSSYQLETPNE